MTKRAIKKLNENYIRELEAEVDMLKRKVSRLQKDLNRQQEYEIDNEVDNEIIEEAIFTIQNSTKQEEELDYMEFTLPNGQIKRIKKELKNGIKQVR